MTSCLFYSILRKNVSMAMKGTLLINSSQMAFYLLAFDIRHLCKGCGRMQLRALSLRGPPSDCLLLLKGGHPSENIDCWTVSPCVCIRKVALVRNCICCLLLSYNGEAGDFQSSASEQAWQEVQRNTCFFWDEAWEDPRIQMKAQNIKPLVEMLLKPSPFSGSGRKYRFWFFIVGFWMKSEVNTWSWIPKPERERKANQGSALSNRVSYSGVTASGADHSGVILLSVAVFLALR